MYVLMDIEWYERGGEQIPTQLAALRIDDSLERVTEFYTRFNPGQGKFDWSSIAFSGGRKTDFRNMAALPYLLGKFNFWLNNDDILIWWHESGAKLLGKLYEAAGLEKPQMCVIHRSVAGQSAKNVPGAAVLTT